MNEPANLDQFFRHWSLFHKDSNNWRLTKPFSGEINGLPHSRGLLRATNGILCYIETNTGLFCGHLEWFVADKPEIQEEVNKLQTAKANSKTRQHQLGSIIQSLDDLIQSLV